MKKNIIKFLAPAMAVAVNLSAVSVEAALPDNLSYMTSPQYGLISNYSDLWLNPVGVIGEQEYDLDQDGQDELLITRITEEKVERDPYVGYPMQIEVYEKNGSAYELQAARPYGAFYIYNDEGKYDEFLVNENQWNTRFDSITIINREDGLPYLFCQHYSTATRFADGYTESHFLLEYDGENINDVAHYTQTCGGSCDFEYTGYKFENNQCVSEQLLSSEMNPGSALYGSSFDDAIRNFFGGFGITLLSQEHMWESYQPIVDFSVHDAVLAMEFTVEYTGKNYQPPYEICAFTGSRDQLQQETAQTDPNAGWLRAYADALYEWENYQGGKFELIFVDDNDLPELLITLGGAHISSPQYYTYQNDSLVDLDHYGSFGTTFYAPRTGQLIASGMSHGYDFATYYKLENASVIKENSVSDNVGAVVNESEKEYYVDEVKVSQDEHQAIVDYYNNNYSYIEAGINTGFDITAANIQAMLADPAAFVAKNSRVGLPANGLSGITTGALNGSGNGNGSANGAAGSSTSGNTSQKDFADSYAIEGSDSRYLTREDVQNLTAQAACYAKNEIYARRGRMFKSKELQEFFGAKNWYNGTIPGDSFSDNVFNDYERKNIDLLAAREHELASNGYALDQPGYDIYAVQ